jgi:hypothetical protein
MSRCFLQMQMTAFRYPVERADIGCKAQNLPCVGAENLLMYEAAAGSVRIRALG